ASKLSIGAVQYSAFCYEDGGIVDDLLVYKLGDEHYMMVVNGANEYKDWEWCSKNAEGFDLELINSSDSFNLLAVQGPASRETVQKLCSEDLSEDALKFYHFVKGKVAGY